MKRGVLWRLSIAISPEAEEAVALLLEDIFSQPAVCYTDAETGATSATVFCQKQSALSGAKRGQLVAGLQRIKECGVNVGLGKISVAKVRPQDWTQSWKRHFKPIEIGRALLIKPSWSRRCARNNQATVVLDPGLSFGTGQHATTAFCLRQLAACRRAGQAQSFLDIGTGSGILAIAAAKLGYAPVRAIDCDAEAVRAARANARQNGVSHRLHISRQDLLRLPRQNRGKYDVICANVTAELLLAGRRRILTRLKRDSTLVLAGILKTEFAQVQQTYETAGLRLVASRAEREWRSGAFTLGRQLAD